ncbi:MAG: glycosyl transferase [Kiritimatiellaceae bacterium]|jgi:glycosyltransferase involved in cell wall biosynthesis|nr:glycosyl transferase [Kiritimatiellaceae bacterium]
MMKCNVSKADLHVHSKYSDRPSQWFLRRIGAPESFLEPVDIYESCRRAGMDYVTITDHNTIQGSLDIAHFPGTFISSELTTYFPENGCKLHIVVSGITENQFGEMQHLRENIYDLQDYMLENRIVHSVAHPLYQVNNKLTVELFEKMILLFSRFESINGSRNPRACDISTALLCSLTPEMITQLADKHGIKPVGLEPWNKTFIGGSDDTGGLYIAGAYTVTPKAASVIDYIEFLRGGQHEAQGESGTSIRLANNLYRIAYQFYKERFITPGMADRSLVGNFLQHLSKSSMEKPAREIGIRAAIKSKIKKKVQQAYIKTQMGDLEQMIVEELSAVLEEGEAIENEAMNSFTSACRISQQLSFAFLKKAVEKIRKGELIGSLQAISSMGPMALGVAPYFTAFSSQHRDEQFLRELCRSFPAVGHLEKRGGGKAWVTDTFEDVNGVTKTIRTLAGMAHDSKIPITVVTCLDQIPQVDFPLKNFNPIGSFRMPEYESLLISFPPFLEMIAYFEEEEFDEIIISTPGSLGLIALVAAKMLGLSVRGIYHTDFPRFFRDISGDDRLGEMTWRFMRWFYGKMDQVLVPSLQYKKLLIDGGFEPTVIDVMPRGINLKKFNREFRKPTFYADRGLVHSFRFIYAGRISREKNIEQLLKAFKMLCDRGVEADLVLVGDGPLRENLEAKYGSEQILFMGYMYGDELAEAYASADLFVFPSRTDTFGNVVLEAHASGLPAIVSNEGGPQEIVGSHGSGLIVDMSSAELLAEAMERVLQDRTLFGQLKLAAEEKAKASRWEYALEKL